MTHSILVVVARALAIASLPFAAVACCSDIKDPDEQLQVEIKAPPAADQSGEASVEERESLCGAEVIAIDSAGTETALQEARVLNVDGQERCVYRATVDPNETYSIRATHDELRGEYPAAESNPGCSVATDPEDTDALVEAARLLTKEERSPAANLRPF